MTDHKVETYKDAEGQHRWRIVDTRPTPHADGSHGPNVVADSGQGYTNKDEMAKSFFGIFFGDYDDSFLTLYNQWNPQAGQVELDDLTANGSQPVTDAVEEFHTPASDLGA